MTNYGGFWIRVIAYIIDAIILNVASLIVGLLFGGGLVGTMTMTGGSQSDLVEAANYGGGIIGLLMSWLYYALMESSARQATVGKMAFGLIVTDEAGQRIGFGRATGRFFAKILSAIVLMIGFIMVAFTQRKQGLHDLVASTLVVKARPGSIDVQNASVFE